MWVSIGESLLVFPATLPMGETGSKSISAGARGPFVAPAARTPEALDAVMDRYAQGDGRGFDDLYRAGAPRVRGFLPRLCGDASLADDLTQETFVRVHRA